MSPNPTRSPQPGQDASTPEPAELRAGADWKFAMMGALAEPRARRVYTAAELFETAKRFRPDVAPKTVRTAVDLFVAAGALRRVSNGVYLNRRCMPPATLAEVAGYVRSGAVISLQTVLGECGFLNNPTSMVTAVLPLSPSRHPNVGDIKTQGGDVFRFHGLGERFFPMNRDDEWQLLQPGRPCPMFRPEAALLHWLHLSAGQRSTMTPPPVDVDMDVLDPALLDKLAERWGLRERLQDWLHGARMRGFGDEVHVEVSPEVSVRVSEGAPGIRPEPKGPRRRA